MRKKIGEFIILFCIVAMMIGILSSAKGSGNTVVIDSESVYEVDKEVDERLFINDGNVISRANERVSILIQKGVNGTLEGLYKIIKKIVA